MSPRTIAYVVVLIAGAIGSWYLTRSELPRRVDDLSYEPVHRGYYLKQARILGIGEDGTALYEIEAEYAVQQEDNRIEFTNVRIRYSPESGVPWTIDADEATLSEDSPRITLRGHVLVLNKGETAADDTEIRTEYLELDPKLFIAQTDARVQIRFGARSVTATGMLASLNDDRIELKANVRGKIAP